MGSQAELDEEFALLWVLIITGPALIFSRQWILRKRTRTLAVNITDSAALLCGVLFFVAAGMMIGNVAIERNVRKTTDNELLVFLTIMTKNYLKRYFVVGLCNTIQLYLLKAAFLGQFASLISRSSRKSYFMYVGACIYTALSFVAIIALQLGICYPVSKNWDLSNLLQICFSYAVLPFNEVLVALNVSTDILVLAVALTIISSLKLGSRERVALFLIVSIGFVSIAMCVVRFVQFYMVVTVTKTPDLKWSSNMIRWQTLEIQLAVVAFCLPAYRSLCVRFFKGRRADTGTLTDLSATQLSTQRTTLGWKMVGYQRAESSYAHEMTPNLSRGIPPPDTVHLYTR